MPVKTLRTQRLTIRHSTVDDVGHILQYLIRNKAHFEPWDPLCKDDFYTYQHQLERFIANQESKAQERFFLFKASGSGKIITVMLCLIAECNSQKNALL